MKILRKRLIEYFHVVLDDAIQHDKETAHDFESAWTDGIRKMLKAIQNGEQLEIVE